MKSYYVVPRNISSKMSAWYRLSREQVISSVLALFLILLAATCPVRGMILDASGPHPANAIWIEPSNAVVRDVGDKFNLTVWLNITEESFAWQVTLLFNSTYFNASRAGYTNGSKSDFFSGHSTVTVSPVISNSAGYAVFGETLLSGDQRDSGHGSLVWMEFTLIDSPDQGQFSFLFSYPYGDDTFVLTPYLETIALDTIDGSAVSVVPTSSSTILRDIVIVVAVVGIAVGAAIVIIRKRRLPKNE